MHGTFAVQLVRTRRKICGRAKPPLQTLKRPFCMHIRARELAITVPQVAPSVAPTRTSSILRYFAPMRPMRPAIAGRKDNAWLNVDADLVKSVKVKGRMLKVVLQDEKALILRAKDTSEAVEAATVMMDAWGIEPLVETRNIEEQGIEQLSKLYLNNSYFRSIVHQMHAHIESLELQNDLPASQ